MLPQIHRFSVVLVFAVVAHFAGAADLTPRATAPVTPSASPAAASLAAMRRTVAEASAHGLAWSGPTSGPPAQAAGRVAIVVEDLRNGGILGVAKGVEEAASVIGWKVGIYDAGGTPAGRRKAFADAFGASPAGVILIGADAAANKTQLMPFAERGIPVVGWHVGPVAGTLAEGPVAMNVSTDPLAVARLAAMAAVVGADGRAGVVLFTDSNFAIAMAKADAMAKVIKSCAACSLLEIRDVPISRSADLMPAITRELLGRHGKRWTVALAINDIYFDYAVPGFTAAARTSDSIRMFSAGDGSTAAFLRIRAGTFQTATAAEPLNLQGWQLVDELNRLLAGLPVSGYVFPVHLITAANIDFDGGPRLQYDPDNGYRDIYRRLWKR
jgi:ribose transport system substrate-binding protein